MWVAPSAKSTRPKICTLLKVEQSSKFCKKKIRIKIAQSSKLHKPLNVFPQKSVTYTDNYFTQICLSVSYNWHASGHLWRAFGVPWLCCLDGQKNWLGRQNHHPTTIGHKPIDARGPKWRWRGPEARQSTVIYRPNVLYFVTKMGYIRKHDLNRT